MCAAVALRGYLNIGKRRVTEVAAMTEEARAALLEANRIACREWRALFGLIPRVDISAARCYADGIGADIAALCAVTVH